MKSRGITYRSRDTSQRQWFHSIYLFLPSFQFLMFIFLIKPFFLTAVYIGNYKVWNEIQLWFPDELVRGWMVNAVGVASNDPFPTGSWIGSAELFTLSRRFCFVFLWQSKVTSTNVWKNANKKSYLEPVHASYQPVERKFQFWSKIASVESVSRFLAFFRALVAVERAAKSETTWWSVINAWIAWLFSPSLAFRLQKIQLSSVQV